MIELEVDDLIVCEFGHEFFEDQPGGALGLL
jgi:hypothetical protein